MLLMGLLILSDHIQAADDHKRNYFILDAGNDEYSKTFTESEEIEIPRLL